MAIVYLNGRFVPQEDAALDPLDRGVLHGDGVFETVRCEQGQLLFHLAHFARLSRSARIVHLPWKTPSENLLAICQQVLDANGLHEARVRITLTRGDAPGLELQGRTAPTLIVTAAPFDPAIHDAARMVGYAAHVADFPRNHRSPLAQVKSTSYQEYLLARHQAREAGADEALLLNTDGMLAEGATSNLFVVHGNRVRTPPVEDGALPGIIRLKLGLLCSRPALDVVYTEESLTLDDLMSADEAFLTNAMIEVMPLVRVNNRAIADGKPGPLTARLFAEHRRDVELFLEAMRTG